MCQNLYFIYSSILYNLECLWPVWPQHSKKAPACDGLVIMPHVKVDISA